MRGYRPAWVRRDVMAGLTLVAIAVPEQMATAGLVGAPTVVGLYAFVAGSVAFAVLGRHPQLSIGADSTIAPVMATGIGHPGRP
jgi:MFS superfamily sulfate permease-like transporter